MDSQTMNTSPTAKVYGDLCFTEKNKSRLDPNLRSFDVCGTWSVKNMRSVICSTRNR